MATVTQLTGHAAFRELADELRDDEPPRFALFVAARDPELGASWCPDCRAAEPLIQRIADELRVTLWRIDVGDRPTWKDPENAFRRDEQLPVTSVPTLVRLGRGGRPLGEKLGEKECQNEESLRRLFTAA